MVVTQFLPSRRHELGHPQEGLLDEPGAEGLLLGAFQRGGQGRQLEGSPGAGGQLARVLSAGAVIQKTFENILIILCWQISSRSRTNCSTPRPSMPSSRYPHVHAEALGARPDKGTQQGGEEGDQGQDQVLLLEGGPKRSLQGPPPLLPCSAGRYPWPYSDRKKEFTKYVASEHS